MTDALVVLVTTPIRRERGRDRPRARRGAARRLRERRPGAPLDLPLGGEGRRTTRRRCSSSRPRARRFEALRERVLALHPYEVPEVIALPVEAGSAPYLAWIAAETR